MNLLVKVPGFGANQDTRSIPSFDYLEILRKHYSVAGSRDTMVSKTDKVSALMEYSMV